MTKEFSSVSKGTSSRACNGKQATSFPYLLLWLSKRLEKVIILKQDGTMLIFSKESTGQSSKRDLKKESDIKNYLKPTAGGQKAAASIMV